MNIKGLLKKSLRKLTSSNNIDETSKRGSSKNSEAKYSVLIDGTSRKKKMDENTTTPSDSRSRGRKRMSFGKSVINIIHRLIILLIRMLCQFIYGEKGQSMPPIKNLILLDSAATLALKIRTKKVIFLSIPCPPLTNSFNFIRLLYLN